MSFLSNKKLFLTELCDVCSEGHIVRIERLEVGDAGTYRCEARNQEGGNSSSIQISVDSSEYQFIF